MKVMGLAALPLAGLLATGGVAMAQAGGPPAGTQVVTQAAVHRATDPCPEHAVKAAVKPVQQQQQVRDRDCGTSGDHKAPQPAGTVTRTAAHSHHGDSCDHADD
jgi:hypothetical protein